MNEIIFRGVKITQEMIIDAIFTFDKENSNDTRNYDGNWLRKRHYKYALRYKENLYPCKRILSLASGIALKDFSGGKETNTTLQSLDFIICKKPINK